MLLVAGNLVYDWIAGPVAALDWDQTVWPAHFAAGLGGNGGTTAYAAARLGTRVRLVSACGDDLHGTICKDRLASVGVDGVYLPGLSGGTALTMGLFRADGARVLAITRKRIFLDRRRQSGRDVVEFEPEIVEVALG